MKDFETFLLFIYKILQYIKKNLKKDNNSKQNKNTIQKIIISQPNNQKKKQICIKIK